MGRYQVLLSLNLLSTLFMAVMVFGEKRTLPTNQNCDPRQGSCSLGEYNLKSDSPAARYIIWVRKACVRGYSMIALVKGDWVRDSVADCEFERSLLHPLSCSPLDNFIGSWVVEQEKNGRCKPVNSKPLRCGELDTRCVCSSPKIYPNTCRCQYWTEDTPGINQPAFCTGHYVGGESRVHHWACCNNCKESTGLSCDGHTYQGGSSGNYCNSCGQSTGGGIDKYFFNCGSCTKQTKCSARCSQWNWPGGCPFWLDCFKRCCETSGNIRRAELDEGFCGDAVCQAKENADTCPSDCCSTVNANCTITSGSCPPECCLQSSCCLATANETTDDGRGARGGSILVATTPLTLLFWILGMTVLA